MNKTAAVVGYASAAVGLATGVVQIRQWLPDDDINLILSDNVAIDRCLVIQGSAPTRDGKELMEAHHSNANRYYFNRAIRTSGDDFKITTNVGKKDAEGTSFIEVFYVDADIARFTLGLDGTGADGSDGQASGSELPPGAENIERRSMRRVPDPRSC